jgi:Tfp pilus assembly protein PilF
MNNLATFYSDRGRLEESEQLQAKVLERGRRSLGADHPRVLIWMNNLGMTYLDEDKLDAAYEVLKRTLELRQQTLGPEHPETLISLSNLGLVQYRRGQLADAEVLLTRAWAASDRVFDANNVRRIVIGERLAAVTLDRRKFAEAASILRIVSDARSKKSPDDWRTFATLARFGDALVGLGRYAEAEPLLINAYRELMQRAQTIPDGQKSVLKSTSDSIFALYAAWRKPDKRRLWERELKSHE